MEVHRRGAEIAEGDFSFTPIGSGDWSRNSVPSGTKIDPFDGCGAYYEPYIEK